MKKDKSDVNYSVGTPAEHCGNCQHFMPRDDACEVVKGAIYPRYWCSRWAGGKPSVDRRAAA